VNSASRVFRRVWIRRPPWGGPASYAGKGTQQRASCERLNAVARIGAVLLLTCSLSIAAPIAAKTLRFASAFDPQTMDPHSLALLYHSRVNTQIYESLVTRE